MESPLSLWPANPQLNWSPRCHPLSRSRKARKGYLSAVIVVSELQTRVTSFGVVTWGAVGRSRCGVREDRSRRRL